MFCILIDIEFVVALARLKDAYAWRIELGSIRVLSY
jgi:hypothetical protein